MLASAGFKQVHIWRIGTVAPLRTFRQHTDLVRSVAWSPDGALIASVGDDNVARVWNPESLQQVLELATGPDRAIGWSPDGSRLATSGASGMLKIWNSASGALLHSARLQTTISGLAWSPNGTRIAVAGVNGMTILWDANTGKAVVADVGELARAQRRQRDHLVQARRAAGNGAWCQGRWWSDALEPRHEDRRAFADGCRRLVARDQLVT
jgi:WD40 repeat protein